MCIGFVKVARSAHDKYRLIILSNRDEVLDRPTSRIHWHNGILSGVDEQDAARGTWFGMNKFGKIGMLLSITQPHHTKNPNAPSRGEIVENFLNSPDSLEFLENLKLNASKYNGFQFVAIERNSHDLFEIRTLTNLFVDSIEIVKLENDDGIFVFSNSPAHVPLKKVTYGHELLRRKMRDSNELKPLEIFERLLEIGTDRTCHFPDGQIEKQTGLGDEYNKPLCSIFVQFPNGHRYGTRTHTMVVVESDTWKTTVLEKSMEPENGPGDEATWTDECVEFQLLPNEK